MKIPIACSLEADDIGDRLAAWQAALARATTREVECCAFFTFVVTVTTDGLALDVNAPADARPLLDDLFGSMP